ncbi:MAG TPA: MarR family transcriptional regulator [Thermoanaerobaculia bacterium]|nr:MarR family transcriptional regulator [Thermoanaerobaculia bacterium]
MPAPRDPVAGIIRAANLLNRSLAPVLERGGITPQQWAVLSVIGAAAAPMTLAAMGKELAVTKQNMTGMVSRLEQLGLVERLEDPADLRSSRVQLTRRGRKMIGRMTSAYQRWVRSLGSERDLRQLAGAVSRLIARLEES